MIIEGWLFDAYPLSDRMVFWIKKENGDTIRLEDNYWSHSIYVASDYINKFDLEKLILKQQEDNLIKDCELVSMHKRITDATKSDVFKLTLLDSTKALALAKRIEKLDKFGKLNLYNVDLLPAQSYFYDHDIFPLAFCKVVVDDNNNHLKKLNWLIEDDSVWSTDYQIPSFKIIHLDIKLKKESREGAKIPRYSDRISSISIKQKEEIIQIENESEQDIIDKLVSEVAKINPDIIFTEDGDSFTFPYLIYRAEKNGINLILGREESIPLKKSVKEGISYFSYGRVYFKPSTQKLLGRIHLDKSNSFVWNESGLQGLYEISRVCRMPLHSASRASIGKCLSSLQFYYATQKEIIIPWKPTLAEHFKTFEELFIADRGGFIFEPKIGVHEQVAEFDFVSLYPNIMLKKNVSAETILCDCCPDPNLRVPELNYNICEKKTGIVPMSLQIVLDKRAEYKQLLKSPISKELKTIYDARQRSLKWILVTSFGYLGFNNAKFGRIDAHIAVCAFDRQILLQTAKIAERHGFRVLHGIVDSLWIQNKKNDTIKQDGYFKLKELIEKEIGFAISFEGIYKWIAFVPSKIKNQLPVPNRYFGIFEDGSLKVRGMETRRHDTPRFLSNCQQEILEIIAKYNNIKEVKALIPKVRDSCFQKYSQLLKEGKVPLKELVFTKRLSKDSNKYQINRNTIENNAIQQLDIEGKSLKAGQILKYVITDYYNRKKCSKNSKRTIPVELINEKTTTIAYDVRKYTELLAEACNSVTEPFGYSISTKDITKYI